jgi:hypothetical protein
MQRVLLARRGAIRFQTLWGSNMKSKILPWALMPFVFLFGLVLGVSSWTPTLNQAEIHRLISFSELIGAGRVADAQKAIAAAIEFQLPGAGRQSVLGVPMPLPRQGDIDLLQAKVKSYREKTSGIKVGHTVDLVGKAPLVSYSN